MLGEPAIASLLMTAATYLVRRGSGEETRGLETVVASSEEGSVWKSLEGEVG